MKSSHEKALAKKRTVFVGKVERNKHDKNTYHASGNRTNASKEKYTHEGDRKYGASGMGGSHASAIRSLVEGDWRMRHGRREAPKNAKFKMN